MASPKRSIPDIPDFYAGRSIFITGATGFMGKVLVERLLSTCPDISRLYLLMRTKKDVLPEKRLLQLKQSPVFDGIKKTNPSQLEKLCIIPGDVQEPQLGMTIESLSLLHEVSVVFHSAATLKFDEALPKAVEQNVRSVMRLMDICDRLPKIEAFVHVSTAYSNADREFIEEKVYPPPSPIDNLLSLVDSAPPQLLAEITNKYISPKPNTYTFTKAIAESAIEQHCNRRYSVAIFRPTIVISALRHPYPGWVENLNGPSGIIVGAGKGLLHVFCCKLQARADMLPVDIAIDTLIAVAWETAVDRSPDVKVYNCSTYENPTNWARFEKALRLHLREHPLDNAMWYPTATTVENMFVEKSLQFLFQTLPLYAAEYGARLLGIKTRINLITANQKLLAMNSVLKFFTMREWRFSTDNVRRLKERLSERDAHVYNLDPHSIDWDDHFSNFVKGTRRYLLGEKESDVEKARRHMRRLKYVHKLLLCVTFLLLCRLLLQNQYVHDIVHATVRAMLSLFNSVIMRMVA